MSREGEIAYLRGLDAASLAHAAAKPFSDPACGDYLLRVAAILTLLPPPPARLLDLGCGSGWTSALFARRGYSVTGVDLAPDMVELARSVHGGAGLDLRFEVGEVERLELAEAFEVVVFFDALHHCADERRALAAAHRALVAGGVCVASEPGRGHSRSPGAREAVERFGVTERDMPPSRIARAARAVGFRRVESYPHPPAVNTAAYRPPPERGARRMLGWPGARAFALAWVQLVHRRRVGLVVLRK